MLLSFPPLLPPSPKGRGEMLMVMVMVMVVTLTRSTTVCSLCQEERCAEDVVRSVRGRTEGGAFCLTHAHSLTHTHSHTHTLTSRTEWRRAEHSALCDTTRVHAAARSKTGDALQPGRLLPTRASSFLPVTSRISRVMSRSTLTASHRDEIFAAVVSRLPVELRTAMVDNGLVNPGLLRHYPRSALQDLGISGRATQLTDSGSGASGTYDATGYAVDGGHVLHWFLSAVSYLFFSLCSFPPPLSSYRPFSALDV